MKKFIVIYHAPMDALAQMANMPKEEMQKGMEGWYKWAQECGDKLMDLGTPLMGGQKLGIGGKATPSERQVCGYSILQAKDIDEAISLLQGHPHLGWNAACEIEVHESMPLPGT